jgi:hypothetical protein
MRLGCCPNPELWQRSHSVEMLEAGWGLVEAALEVAPADDR